MVIEEPVDVELSAGGAPIRFVWRGVHYGVVAAPEPWFGREPWWVAARRAPRGGAARFEREMWRVDAVPLDGSAPVDGTFDLAHTREGWQLDRAWDDELETRLFA